MFSEQQIPLLIIPTLEMTKVGINLLPTFTELERHRAEIGIHNALSLKSG
jgi:hypothetical protein